jgi:hypothetical protein
MSKNLSIDVEKIRGRISEAKGEKVSRTDLAEILGTTTVTLSSLEKSAPKVVRLLNNASKITGLSINELLKELT